MLVPMNLIPTLAAAAVLTAPLAACGSSSPTGFNDPGALSARLKVTAQQRMDKRPDVYGGAKVTDTKCVRTADHVFKCMGEINSGERWTIRVTVSADGRTYVSETL